MTPPKSGMPTLPYINHVEALHAHAVKKSLTLPHGRYGAFVFQGAVSVASCTGGFRRVCRAGTVWSDHALLCSHLVVAKAPAKDAVACNRKRVCSTEFRRTYPNGGRQRGKVRRLNVTRRSCEFAVLTAAAH